MQRVISTILRVIEFYYPGPAAQVKGREARGEEKLRQFLYLSLDSLSLPGDDELDEALHRTADCGHAINVCVCSTNVSSPHEPSSCHAGGCGLAASHHVSKRMGG